MAIYAISDLHLSFNKSVTLDQVDPDQGIEKPMEEFGWGNHYDLVRMEWEKCIKETDTVLLPGDISWALRWDQAQYDFGWIAQLPGRKVFSPGNHEYYYHSKRKIRSLLPEKMEWIDADYTLVEEYIVAGTRGWSLPGEPYFTDPDDRKIYERQVGRLRLALESAKKDYPDRPMLVMLHFPPITQHVTTSGFMELLEEFQVKICIYGHLHGPAIDGAVQGVFDGIELRLVSCDALDFRPVKLIG